MNYTQEKMSIDGLVIQCLHGFPHAFEDRKTLSRKGDSVQKKDPAATYSSGASPLKYHRRMKA